MRDAAPIQRSRGLAGAASLRLRSREMLFAGLVALLGRGPIGARAETLNGALARAYEGNPDLYQSRANVRARDEDAPKALAGMRPKASISANAGPELATVKYPRDATTLAPAPI